MTTTSARFVAVRPPVASGAIDVITPTLAQLSQLEPHVRMAPTPMTLAAAWRMVADSIRGQGPYFRLDETGRMLAARTEPVLELLRAAPGLTVGELRDRVREIAGPVAAAEPVPADLHAGLLFGHWAWVMSPDEAPQDGRVTRAWLVVQHLLASPDTDEWARRRARVGRIRVGFPARLLRLEVGAPDDIRDPGPGPGRNLPAGKAALAARIAKLNAHRAALRALFEAKIAQVGVGTPTGPEADPNADPKGGPKAAPWRVLPGDVQAHPELFELVRSLDLDPLAADIPSQLDALDAASAALQDEAAARPPGRVRLVGSTFLLTHDDEDA